MTKEEQKAMANRIKKRRKSLNFTQEQFAELLGISASSYTRIENAFQNPALNTLINISKNLKISIDYMIFGNEDIHGNVATDTEVFEALVDFSDMEKLRHAAEVLDKFIKIKENKK